MGRLRVPAATGDDGALSEHGESAEGHGYVVAVVGDVDAAARQLTEHTSPHRHLGMYGCEVWVYGCGCLGVDVRV